MKACLRGGMAGAEVDMAGAVALATGMGVAPPTAAALLAACGEGIMLARQDRAERDEGDAAGEEA
ncbi:hypothetical protein [Roseomonas xinghualingensis]|uniref:hypothetical protein n=1 Tax=Roseomonas xinghualingensis TaxID=2986475 RepID=UPI0021F1D4A8|nr:hypothetical protein [Roseomonas sp. SXEYE001]MCV4209992.1 hypothetical protein [Roseomonas sp. SXEYE001]